MDRSTSDPDPEEDPQQPQDDTHRVGDEHGGSSDQSPPHAAEEGDEASAVGHEVAPPRVSPRPDDVGYYARTHPAEEELPDNAASDVRRVPSALQRQTAEGGLTPLEDEDIPSAEAQGEPRESAQRADDAAAAPAKPSSHINAATATTTTTATLSRQPCHGTQVDAEADISATTAAAGGVPTGDAATAPIPSSSSYSSPAPADPPRWSLLPQAAHGTAEVTVVLLPMQALTRVTVPVHNPNLYRPTPGAHAHDNSSTGSISVEEASTGNAGGAVAGAGGGTSPHWVLMAKELFEAVAQHLTLHPQSFHVYHQHKRLRFMGTLFLDCDVTSSLSGAEPAENNRAEPVWVSVTFPDPAAAPAAGMANPQQPFPSSSASHLAEEEAEEAHASMAGVPAHLAHLGPDDYVARCVQVRRHKVEIPPRTLMEGRRQGYSYDDVIRQMQALHDTSATTEGKGEGSNLTMIAILHDGPAPPVKPFLGGYRDRQRTEHVLLHAATQLYHRDLEYSPFAKTGAAGPGAADRSSRQTQTFGISRSCQTHREACAQTPRVDLLLDTSHDFVVVARPYFAASALRDLQEEMAVVIQKLYRQWKARRVKSELEAAESARQYRAGARQRREETLHAAVEDAAQLRRDDPRSAADFARVKQDVVAWRAEEAARIQQDASLSPTDARAALLAITKKELQLLQRLDQRRREVGKTREEMAFVHNLDRMAAPKQWGTVHVVTPETERAGELRDLYDRLVETSAAGPSASTRNRGGGAASTRMASSAKADAASPTPSPLTSSSPGTFQQSGTSPSAAATLNASGAPLAASPADDGLTSATAARLDILLRVKWTVREFHASSAVARELADLIDREADLLHRGRRDTALSGLRKRIQALFAEFIEDPAYNPGVINFVQTARGRARVAAVESEKSLQQSKTQKSRA